MSSANKLRINLGSVAVDLRASDEDIYAGEIRHSAFKAPLTIEVFSLSSELTPEQVAHLRKGFERLTILLPDIKKSVYRYFLDRRAAADQYGNAWGDNFEGIDSADGCWESLEDCRLTLDLFVEEPGEVSLRAVVPWQLDGRFAVEFLEDGSWSLPDENPHGV